MIKVSVCVCVCLICIYPMPSQFSPVQLFATLWTVAFQSPLSMGFSWQEYWSGLPFPPPWDHPNTGTEATSPASSTGRWILYQWVTGEVQSCCMCCAVLCLVAQLCPILCTAKTAACQGPLSMGILQPRILEWFAISPSRGSFWPRNQTHISYVSCIGKWVLHHHYHYHYQGSPYIQ